MEIQCDINRFLYFFDASFNGAYVSCDLSTYMLPFEASHCARMLVFLYNVRTLDMKPNYWYVLTQYETLFRMPYEKNVLTVQSS